MKKNNLDGSAVEDHYDDLGILNTTERVLIRDVNELEKSVNIPNIYPSALFPAISSIVASILNHNGCINFNRFVEHNLSDEEYNIKIIALMNIYTKVKKLELTIFEMFDDV